MVLHFCFAVSFIMPKPFLLVPGGRDLQYIYCDPPPRTTVTLWPNIAGLSFSPQKLVFTKDTWNISFEIFVSPTLRAGQLLVDFNVTGEDKNIFETPPKMETFITDLVILSASS